MEIEILSEKENPLLNRKEINFKVKFDSRVPSINEVREKLISKLKSNEKLTIVNGFHAEFGVHHAKGYAKIYENEKILNAIEPKFRINKNFGIMKKTAEEKEKKEQEIKEKVIEKEKDEVKERK